MATMADMQRRLAGLRERGILVIGKDARPEEAAGAFAATGHHAFVAHNPVWNFVPPRCARPMGPTQEPPLYESLPAGTPLPRALARTKLCLFAGATPTPELLLALARPDTPCFVFEPRQAALRAFLDHLDDATLARGQAFLFCGDHTRFDRPLADFLGPQIFQLGYPVFFATPDMAARYGGWLAGLMEYLETLFFRHRIYPLEGQTLSRSLPLRPIAQGLFYDQTRHLYENTPLFLTSGRIDAVRNAFAGETAVCVAAGPALDGQIDLIRRAQANGALVIAVNNALRPLAANGLHPHFAVINDTSVLSGRAFTGLTGTARTVLVAHPLSATGQGAFQRRLFFDSMLPELFGKRTGLRLHGSVISTAFSLARHLGCARAVLAGVQLAMPERFGYAYAKSSIHDGTGVVTLPAPLPPDIWPAQYPVRTASGRRMFTTPNFLDACIWLRDEIRTSGLPVVNLTADSILFGPGITVDPGFVPEPEADKWARLESLPPAPPPVDRRAVLDWLAGETRLWETVAQGAGEWLETARPAEERLAVARALIGRFDASGVSYTGQRYGDFNNEAFHAAFFDGADTATRLGGATCYFTSLRAMSAEFLALIARARQAVAGAPAPGT